MYSSLVGVDVPRKLHWIPGETVSVAALELGLIFLNTCADMLSKFHYQGYNNLEFSVSFNLILVLTFQFNLSLV